MARLAEHSRKAPMFSDIDQAAKPIVCRKAWKGEHVNWYLLKQGLKKLDLKNSYRRSDIFKSKRPPASLI
jgi:hypothetical protein